jgi:LEA14-like dessication related protein
MRVRHPALAFCTCALAAVLVAVPARAASLGSPSITLERLRIERLTGRDANVAVTLSIENPNEREVALDAVEMNLELADIKIGTASLAAPVVLASHARTSATFHAVASPDALAAALAASLDRGQVDYLVAGIAQIDGGAVPFVQRGHKKLSDLLDGRP